MAENRNLSQLDPEFAKLPRPPTAVGPVDVATFRGNFANRVLPAMQAATKDLLPPESEHSVAEHGIEVESGVKVTARVTVPTPRSGEDGKYPVLFWLHAGGWILGNLEMDNYYHRRLAVDHRISVVNLDYRLAPEHPFPIPIHDSLAGLKHATADPDLYSADLSRGFIVSGAATGANMATVLAHLTLNDPEFQQTPLTGQLLMNPLIVHPSVYPEEYRSSLLSYEEIIDVPGLTRDTLKALWDFYNPSPSDPKASPLLFPSRQGLPRTYIQVCGLDPLRDEGILYEKVLRAAGVETKVETYAGVPHGFHMIYSNLTVAKQHWKDANAGISWLLRRAESQFCFV